MRLSDDDLNNLVVELQVRDPMGTSENSFEAKGVFDDKPRYFSDYIKVPGLRRKPDDEQVYLITEIQ